MDSSNKIEIEKKIENCPPGNALNVLDASADVIRPLSISLNQQQIDDFFILFVSSCHV